MGRAPCCSEVGFHRGAWTAREDMLLTKHIEANGEGHWWALPKKAGLLRCGKSCRLRWLNYLRPDIKRGNISPAEEELIIRLHTLLGNRWSLIAGRLPGRTDNEIKNFWNTHVSKKLRRKGIDPKTHKPLPEANADCSMKDDAPESDNSNKRRAADSPLKNANVPPKPANIQPVHLPKPNRYIACPQLVRDFNFLSKTDEAVVDLADLLKDPDTKDGGLFSPSIDLNSLAYSMSSMNTEESDSSHGTLLNLQTKSKDMLPQPTDSEDYFPSMSIEDWSISNLIISEIEQGNNQTIERNHESMEPVNSPSPEVQQSSQAKSITDYCGQENEMGNKSTRDFRPNAAESETESCFCNIQLQKVYEEYLELLQDRNPDCATGRDSVGASVWKMYRFYNLRIDKNNVHNASS
eukprot:Gb_02020 [translate_table: standard]